MKIIVVGANGTIGTAVSKELESNGHEVVKVGRNSGDYQMDMTNIEDIKLMFEQIKEVDAVISTAGAANFDDLSELTPESNEVAVMSKLLGQINLVLIGQHYINEGGSFTLTTGVIMDDPIKGGVSSAMAGGGINAFVQSAAYELKRNLRINNVSPNVIEEALEDYGDFFKGYTAVPASKAAKAYLKSVEGIQTGQTYRVYE
ncbi:short chain dehydrogenase [Mammaliicoccus stepanovicii]|uniref:Short chain dehydrogenase n=1 Tax=Mammaliicoccus stepanovicii TaxID=643214 RepID=A0A239ZVS5_9STAP|nr:short chain dehydrogenase [Mammaliicoccus stepanovicii]PNZ77438.1 short chain dehydrogenase [Mammaliicoccus stepanovicii]GGI39027.1 short chain dehydrogenase [Mammaliicoccus stepanovicii]SNV74904.1 short chain dehydrogenase [Mammaliicoccus stepanovicii]